MNFWHMNKGHLIQYRTKLFDLLKQEATSVFAEPQSFVELKAECGSLQHKAIELGLEAQVKAVQSNIK